MKTIKETNSAATAKPKSAVKKAAKATPAAKSRSGTKEANGEVKAKTTKKQVTKATAPKKSSVKASLKKAVKFDKKITDKLKSIVANYTEKPELLDNIESDTTKSFIDELNIDSVDFVEIIVDVEQAFDITIEDEEIYELKSFEDLYVAIETKIKASKKK